uniref:Uncharacterized protein n=1 Tax=Arundo donax TaxID=35708 RepID=A0A0A9GQA4_ARUDO
MHNATIKIGRSMFKGRKPSDLHYHTILAETTK